MNRVAQQPVCIFVDYSLLILGKPVLKILGYSDANMGLTVAYQQGGVNNYLGRWVTGG